VVNLPRGFAYAEFQERPHAEKARLHMDGGQLDGNVLSCASPPLCGSRPFSREPRRPGACLPGLRRKLLCAVVPPACQCARRGAPAFARPALTARHAQRAIRAGAAQALAAAAAAAAPGRLAAARA